MTHFGKQNSVPVRHPSYSPGLVAILANAINNDGLTRKQIAAAGDFSGDSAYRIVAGGWRDFDEIQSLVDRLPERTALQVASELCRRFKVIPRGEAERPACSMSECLALAGGSVDLADTLLRADADRFRSPAEHADIANQINNLRAKLDRLEADNTVGSRRRQPAA